MKYVFCLLLLVSFTSFSVQQDPFIGNDYRQKELVLLDESLPLMPMGQGAWSSSERSCAVVWLAFSLFILNSVSVLLTPQP